ncbi:hypothetical protein F8388_017576 [Cannabis sativa]|uniref:Uncharacterized protein n=1 Tax=Cannabis sativa TaxID=3483 RepID=A0A7J6DV93_CANSA|nr:hypothetical protein F8388_017576 [Cannabis sativa]
MEFDSAEDNVIIVASLLFWPRILQKFCTSSIKGIERYQLLLIWDGVDCDDLTGHVIGLNLERSCLYGSVHSNNTLFHLLSGLELSGDVVGNDQSLLSLKLTKMNLGNPWQNL